MFEENVSNVVESADQQCRQGNAPVEVGRFWLGPALWHSRPLLQCRSGHTLVCHGFYQCKLQFNRLSEGIGHRMFFLVPNCTTLPLTFGQRVAFLQVFLISLELLENCHFRDCQLWKAFVPWCRCGRSVETHF